MAENLAYLPSVSPSSEESESSPYYYVYDYQGTSVINAKAESNYDDYGVLYNWPAAMVACPDGWHLPTDAEWSSMEISLGLDPLYADSIALRSSGDVGKKLKSKTGWAKNGNGNNSSGFNVLPAGDRWYANGSFMSLGSFAEFWSASVAYGDEVHGWDYWTREMHFQSDGVYRGDVFPNVGLSVRCVKDN
jgi:uncharacterized protein (TIGR02145 family)